MEVTFVEIQSVFLALFQLQQSAITSRPASYANVRCFVRHLSATLTWFNLVPAVSSQQLLALINSALVKGCLLTTIFFSATATLATHGCFCLGN